MIWEWIRFGISALLVLGGLVIICISVFGVYRFQYVLNRMHAAAMGDTLGISLILLGLIVASGFEMVSLKLLLILIFFWLTSPVSGHMISRLEATTNENIREHCDIADESILVDLENEGQEGANGNGSV